MKYQSFSTVAINSYRAGFEIGDALKPLQPEVILLFLSFNHAESYGDLYEGIRDALGAVIPLVFGCTGDGIYETRNVQHHGACALGMTSGGMVQWTAAKSSPVHADSFTAARNCAHEALSTLGGEATFAMVLADGLQSDGSRLVAGFQSVLSIPFMGGLAADNRAFGQTFVFLNHEALEDTAAVLLGKGPVPFWMNAASGWTHVGIPGTVDKCRGNVIERISGRTAYDFIRAQLGMNPSMVERGIIPLATRQAANGDSPALRSVLHFNPVTGFATMIGSIEEGAEVRVCMGDRNKVIGGVQEALAAVNQVPFEAQAMILVSCAGRKWIMGDEGADEVDKAFALLGRRLPMIGFPSFGEISPYRRPDGSYTPGFFHNVTLGVCLLGE